MLVFDKGVRRPFVADEIFKLSAGAVGIEAAARVIDRQLRQTGADLAGQLIVRMLDAEPGRAEHGHARAEEVERPKAPEQFEEDAAMQDDVAEYAIEALRDPAQSKSLVGFREEAHVLVYFLKQKKAKASARR